MIRRITVDAKFNEITETEVLNSISRAFNSLDHNTRTLKEDMRKDVIERKASQMKETINSFIDWRLKKPVNANMPAKREVSEQYPALIDSNR